MTADGRGLLVAGRYLVHERVGVGGMGVVHRATDTRLHRDVALKRIRLSDLDPDEAAMACTRMMREARIAAQVHHPRIVSIFDVVDHDGEPWLVLEYLPSDGLDTVLRRTGLLLPGAAARIGAQVAEALAAAHAAGIVHRDVKPGNMLVAGGSPDGPVKLADFGISRLTGGRTLTVAGAIVGTVPFLAPEVARGEGATSASDVYGLGATLIAATRGAPPFGWPGEDLYALLRRIGIGADPAPPGGGPLGSVLSAMTVAQPDERPTATEAAAMLWAHADRHEPGGPPVPRDRSMFDADTNAPAAPSRRSRRSWALAGVGVVIVAALVGTAVVLDRRTEAPPPAASAPAASAPAASAPAPGEFPAAVGPLEVGDQRTVDVCAFLDASALTEFGEATVDPAAGRFNGCTATLPQPGSATIAVGVAIDPPTSEMPEGEQQQLGDTLIIRRPGSDTACGRVIYPSDGTRVMINANYRGSGEPTEDVCAIAETATATAARGLAERGIVRREPPGGAGTLWGVESCTVLEPGDLAVLPTVTIDGYRGFGGWDCQFGDDADPETAVQLSFSRARSPSVDEDLTAVPTASGTVYTELDDDLCYAYAEYRPSGTDVHGEALVELVRVRVEGPLGADGLCSAAASLAGSVLDRLPPPA